MNKKTNKNKPIVIDGAALLDLMKNTCPVCGIRVGEANMVLTFGSYACKSCTKKMKGLLAGLENMAKSMGIK